MFVIYKCSHRQQAHQCIKMTLTLYMTPVSPPVRAVLLVAAYLGIALDLKHVDILKGEQLQSDFLKVRFTPQISNSFKLLFEFFKHFTIFVHS